MVFHPRCTVYPSILRPHSLSFLRKAWVAVFVVCLLWLQSASATTMFYYRFEGSTSGGSAAPWRADSSGNGYTLAGSYGSVTQVASVLDTVPVTKTANASAGDFNGSHFYTAAPTGAVTSMSSFTMEALVNWQGAYVRNGVAQIGTIVSQWDGTGGLFSYRFGVDTTGHPMLMLNTGASSSATSTFTASTALTAGRNYYLAASFDKTDATNGIKFYLLDLDDDQATLQVQSMAHTLTALRSPTARIVVGNCAYSGTFFYFNGLIDEVRVSNTPLPRSGLLISGPSFREFSGVNGSGTTNALFSQAVSLNRSDVSWGSLEASSGAWQQSVLDAVGQKVLAFQAQNVSFLPILDYMTSWAADKSARQWDNTSGSVRYTVAPRSDGNMDYAIYAKQSDGTYTLSSSSVISNFTKFPPANVSDWTNYVTKVVTYLHAPPYNVQYFQIWNEAYYTSGFWYGSMDEYMQKIHIPAANAIHAAGGKVVYGGWPICVGNTTELCTLLDNNNAWGTIDVIDTHYFGPSVYNTLRGNADSRGYTSLGIWQSELGWTGYKQFALDQYPRILYWALGANWDSTDKYKAIYFCNQSPNDPAAYGYGKTYYSGSDLAPQGIVLQTLASLLNGVNLSQFTGVTSVPSLPVTLDTTKSAMQAFKVSNKVIICVELNEATYTGNSTIVFTIPLAQSAIAKAERVDLTGTRVDLTSQLTTVGSNTTLSVSVLDAAGSLARTWNDATGGRRGFFVQLTLP